MALPSSRAALEHVQVMMCSRVHLQPVLERHDVFDMMLPTAALTLPLRGHFVVYSVTGLFTSGHVLPQSGSHADAVTRSIRGALLCRATSSASLIALGCMMLHLSCKTYHFLPGTQSNHHAKNTTCIVCLLDGSSLRSVLP